MDFTNIRFDSNIIVSLRGGMLIPIGDFPEYLSQGTFSRDNIISAIALLLLLSLLSLLVLLLLLSLPWLLSREIGRTALQTFRMRLMRSMRILPGAEAICTYI